MAEAAETARELGSRMRRAGARRGAQCQQRWREAMFSREAGGRSWGSGGSARILGM